MQNAEDQVDAINSDLQCLLSSLNAQGNVKPIYTHNNLIPGELYEIESFIVDEKIVRYGNSASSNVVPKLVFDSLDYTKTLEHPLRLPRPFRISIFGELARENKVKELEAVLEMIKETPLKLYFFLEAKPINNQFPRYLFKVCQQHDTSENVAAATTAVHNGVENVD